ncbi:unnamed protein product [Miscanthus lutarioriparius]|uniref:laccase n=1 Tax=Miscanthus lutarioriparius TaxID=422564 RepID=A0A811Q8P7_9POAL|nr:unnamed protein product [Miscanthus lutarioriparius]
MAAAVTVVAVSIILSGTAVPPVAAATVEHTFVVSQVNMTHMCNEIPVTVVNGQLPGPTIEVTEGDTVIVHVVNKSPYNLTIHWGMVGEGPCSGGQNFSRGLYDEFSSGSTINGKLGDLFNCSGVFEDGYVLDVEPGKTYLLRIINAALFSEYFIKIAGHKFTVVAADANYVTPYTTDVIVIAPGETMDALVVADAAPGRYYIAAQPIQAPPPDTQTPEFATRGTLQYTGGVTNSSRADVVAPEMPHEHDTIKSFYFHGNLTGLRHRQRAGAGARRRASLRHARAGLHLPARPQVVQERDEPKSNQVIANMNNVSFHDATATPILEAHYYRRGGNGVVGTAGLPDHPPSAFNYTDPALIPFGPVEMRLEPTSRATVVRRFRHGDVVDIVFQSTAMLQGDSNPMHLHGHDMFVLAQGIGNYDAATDEAKFNLVNPARKNTVLVPNLGWAAIRFVADNPG